MTKRAIQKEDVLSFQWPGHPTISPDGQWVVYERTVSSRKEDDYQTHLFIADRNGQKRRQLTTTGTKNTSHVWSPDSRMLAFISNRSFGTQIWLLPVDGGEARRLTSLRRPVSSLVWAPDGSKIFALVSVPNGSEIEVLSGESSEKEVKEQMEKEDEAWRNGPKRYDWIYYKRDGAGLRRAAKHQLISIDVVSGTLMQLTSGPYDVGEASVSPDGRYLVFTSNRREHPEFELHSDLFRIPSDGGDLELLCNDVIALQPTYSPDGQWIAFFGHRDEYESATQTRLFVVPATGGEPTDLTVHFPDGIGNDCLSDMRSHEHTPGPLWSRDSRSIYALSSRDGCCEVVRFERSGDENPAVVIGGEREIFGIDYDGDHTFAVAYATVTHPGKVALVTVQSTSGKVRRHRALTEPGESGAQALFPNQEIRLDDCNDAVLAELIVVEPEVFWYQSADDWQVQGFVVRPAHFEAGKRYPVILEIHGGPHANFGYSFFHEIQWFAAQGYAVVFVNPRGSTSYGQLFKNGVRGDYGGRDAEDVLNGLNAALERFDFLDDTRVAVTGGSYGGFMTNWLVGHTDRFFAAVSQRSISNWISFYGVSDIGPSFTERQVGGDVMTDFEKLWKHSPLAYVRNVKTPILLLHSENDLRCPIEQAEQFYVCIRRQGGDAELVRIPNANHDLSRNGKPSLRLERLEAIFSYIHARLPQCDQSARIERHQ